MMTVDEIAEPYLVMKPTKPDHQLSKIPQTANDRPITALSALGDFFYIEKINKKAPENGAFFVLAICRK